MNESDTSLANNTGHFNLLTTAAVTTQNYFKLRHYPSPLGHYPLTPSTHVDKQPWQR